MIPADGRAPDISAALARALSRAALRHPWLVLAAGLVVVVGGFFLATRLTLNTDLAELLPSEAPSVITFKQLNLRVGGTGQVAIALEPVDGKPDALRAYVPRLVEALRREMGADLLSLRYSRTEIDDYYRRLAAYYAPLADLTAWSERLAEAIAREANPALVDLDGAAGGQGALRELVDEVRAKRGQPSRRQSEADPQTGLFMAEGGKVAAVFVRPAANSLNLAGSKGMLERIQAVVRATAPEAHGVRLPDPGYTGSIPLALSEMDTVRLDIASTALLVIVLVGGAVVIYFRRLRELMLLTGALAVGSAASLGFAYLWIGHVNAQTAFLNSIIVGTGINYGILYLDRHRRARARGVPFDESVELACAECLRSTWIAALGTAVSFGVLAAGEVESFHQFGWIGGVGILASWLASFTILPALVVVVERRRAPRPMPAWQPLSWAFTRVGRLCVRFPRAIVAAWIAVAAASAILAWGVRHDYVETDLRNLGNKRTEVSGIQKLDDRLRGMDDRSSAPAVIAADSRAETQAVCDVLNRRASGDLKGIVRRCYSINDQFPADLEQRAPVMARLRRDLEKVPDDALTEAERTELADLKRALAEPPPTDRELPIALKQYFVERDGSVGKLAFVEPNNEHIEANLYKFTDAFRQIRLPSGKTIESSGDLVVFADVLRAMRRDARKLTFWAGVLVLAVLAVVTRRLGTFARVASSLLLGVAAMVGAAVLLGQKLNFFNFVALPTTFGIGIDYAINIEERIRQTGRGAIVEALAEIGPPVLLASLTTIIGYAALLTADSRALSSFGSLAIIGEVATDVAAITILPALWALRRGSSRPSIPA